MSSSSPEVTNPDVEERTPLISQVQHPSEEDRSLPFFQIFLLSGCRLVEASLFCSIFPFISEMIQRTGQIPSAEIGWYAGLVVSVFDPTRETFYTDGLQESLFSLTSLLVMIPLGKFSDRFGRKLPLVGSMLLMSLFQILFGLSTSIPFMCIARSLQVRSLSRSIRHLISKSSMTIGIMFCGPSVQSSHGV
jgi:MFS family permease